MNLFKKACYFYGGFLMGAIEMYILWWVVDTVKEYNRREDNKSCDLELESR